MKKLLCLLVFIPSYFFAQQLAPLTVEKIMRDPQWIGTSPSDVFWSPNNQKMYFQWNPDGAPSDSLYSITLKNHTPQKATPEESSQVKAQRWGTWNNDHSKLVYVEGHTLYLLDLASNQPLPLYRTTQDISQPDFTLNDASIVFLMDDNLFDIHLKTGFLNQLTDFRKGHKKEEADPTDQELFIEKDALKNSLILRQRKEEKENAEINTLIEALPKTIYIGKGHLDEVSLSPDGSKVIYQLWKPSKPKNTFVPNYVTQSGYTKNITARSIVGTQLPEFTSYIYDIKKDSIYPIKTDQIPGIHDIPNFIKENYPQKFETLKNDATPRQVYMSIPFWNKTGTRAFFVVRAVDHKDRWLMELNPTNGELKSLDRQRDDAWIEGPGIGHPFEVGNVGWINSETIWYQSEKTGYSHLYTLNVKTAEKKQLTDGKYEIQEAQLSPDHKTFFITSNKVHSGQSQFYQIDIESGKLKRITQKEGGNKVSVSPNGKNLAILYSTSNHPEELFLQANKEKAKEQQITHQAESDEFKSYNWKKSEFLTFKNSEGFEVHAEIFKPSTQATSRPAVIFVHGAGYLQDVKDSWSEYYFREHLFMNLLADQGYTVMNIDYRGSAGYGRDWRASIYRHMGGNDLVDIVEGADYMVKNFNVNPDKIGLWGGSYGGFLTLMALFKTNTFACGAALRSVTDWAHYNHLYTSDILNLPQDDSIAYEKSSPINFAEGLKSSLLMCHGIVDTNVHFQDIVRLTQRLIELGKDNWELAVYPLEGHGFVEPSSWTDEYKRIYKLFEENLK